MHSQGGKKAKGQSRKENQWPPSSKAQGQPMVETSTKMVRKRKRVNDLLSKKGKKRNTPLMTMMFKGYLVNLCCKSYLSPGTKATC